MHKDRIFGKNLLKNKEMVFGNGVKNIQAAAYNGARTVCLGAVNNSWLHPTYLYLNELKRRPLRFPSKYNVRKKAVKNLSMANFLCRCLLILGI